MTSDPYCSPWPGLECGGMYYVEGKCELLNPLSGITLTYICFSQLKFDFYQNLHSKTPKTPKLEQLREHKRELQKV